MKQSREILIVDDQPVVRAGLRQFLAQGEQMRITGEATNGAEALKLVAERDWDLVMLELYLPDGNGLEVLEHIKRLKPNLPVLIYSSAAEEEFALAAIHRGAAGFLSKNSESGDVCLAMRKAVDGEQHVGPVLARQLLAGANPRVKAMPHEQLTVRELEVMVRLAMGEPPKRIADALRISIKTVSTHRMHILEKMRMEGIADLVRYAVTHSLLP